MYYDDDNNDDCDDSKTPFLEKKSPQELQHIETLKTQLLSTVVGLDRGFAANVSQALDYIPRGIHHVLYWLPIWHN